jgi:Putative auto-transporter adhesin, head GIN domain
MRKIFSIAAGTLLLACVHTGISAQDKETEKIKGSGSVITRGVSIQPFDELEASGVFELKLFQGTKEQLKIEAEDNLQDLFEVKNEGSHLKISMKKNAHYDTKKTMKVYLTFRNLKSMDLAMVGNVSSDEKLNFTELKIDNKSVGNVKLDLTAQKLNIENNSVGNFTLSGKVENAVIRHNGVGAIRASDLLVQTMDIEALGVGSAEVNAEKQLKVKDSFLGRVRNRGNATVRRMNKVVI